MSRTLFVALAVVAFAVCADAFSVGSMPAVARESCALPSTARPLRRQGLALRMADLYEDDKDPESAPKRVQGKRGGISDNMRAKLLKENQALGGDPDVASVNWALIIGGIIATLAIFGNLFGAF
eukprot:CAMPEP_0206248008 /NCGR_PEP_ID=MMETSP0047_2-20121206/20125_1 /ASSEMBLY_ACC=CAM_ASM_000192 /TAXON_ID=195065 /ORGANISM="Chroomonas mesostigmatica_cf, Strain CCMP1168" /LENGTH=123 /DNA_ID=CAMNT_0053673593 /DNA_START=29 /DNA_END=400 /DNA_ORIENTATION=-